MRAMGATHEQIGEFWLASGFRLRRPGARDLARSTIRRILNRAAEANDPQPAPLTNLARLFMELPAVADET
jgi:hypothetical protein